MFLQIEEVVKNISTREDRIEAIEKSLRLDELNLDNRYNICLICLTVM